MAQFIVYGRGDVQLFPLCGLSVMGSSSRLSVAQTSTRNAVISALC